MRKFLSVFLFLLFLISLPGCERDEICLEEITPKLIVRFYNKNIPDELKSVLKLKVSIEGIDGEYTNETITSFTDSIAIPIMVTDDMTRFILTLSGDESEETIDNPDTLQLNYSREDVYISRSCGYKTIFHEARESLINDDDNWIEFVATKDDPQEIINENLAHVKIYH